jgi:hypothetical protein
MRSKEEAMDYRYFPDPDLLPLELEQAWIDGIKASLPELPDDKKARFMTEYGLGAYDAGVLVAERARADFYETVAKGRDASGHEPATERADGLGEVFGGRLQRRLRLVLELEHGRLGERLQALDVPVALEVVQRRVPKEDGAHRIGEAAHEELFELEPAAKRQRDVGREREVGRETKELRLVVLDERIAIPIRLLGP